MKKNKIICIMITILVCIFNFKFLSLNAEAQYRDCTYIRTYNGDINSKNNFKFTIRVTPSASTFFKSYSLSYKLIDEDGNEVKDSANYINSNGKQVKVKLKKSSTVDISMKNYIDTSNGDKNASVKECPTLFYEDNSAEQVTIHDVATYSDSQQPFRKLQEADQNGNISTGDKENLKNKTTCTLKVSLYDTTSSDKLNSQLQNQMINLTFDSYEDGKIYVTCTDCTVGGGYLEKSSSGDIALSFKRNSTNVFSQTEFIVYNDDVDELKKLFPYGLKTEDCPDKITLNKYNNGDKISISKDKKSDASSSVSAEKDLTVDGNPDFFINNSISTEKSSCEKLLGGANSNLIKFMQSAWTIIKVAVIIITILMGIFDFIGSITKSKDELMACVNKSVKRLVIVVIILLLPTVIDFIGSTIFKVDNILCGIK